MTQLYRDFPNNMVIKKQKKSLSHSLMLANTRRDYFTKELDSFYTKFEPKFWVSRRKN